MSVKPTVHYEAYTGPVTGVKPSLAKFYFHDISSTRMVTRIHHLLKVSYQFRHLCHSVVDKWVSLTVVSLKFIHSIHYGDVRLGGHGFETHPSRKLWLVIYGLLIIIMDSWNQYANFCMRRVIRKFNVIMRRHWLNSTLISLCLTTFLCALFMCWHLLISTSAFNIYIVNIIQTDTNITSYKHISTVSHEDFGMHKL